MLVISKCFAKSEFQMLEPNLVFGAVNEQTNKLLQTLSQYYLLVTPTWCTESIKKLSLTIIMNHILVNLLNIVISDMVW